MNRRKVGSFRQGEYSHSQTLSSRTPSQQNVILETEFFLENSVSVI